MVKNLMGAAPGMTIIYIMGCNKNLARCDQPSCGDVEDYDPEMADRDAPSADDIARFGDVTVKCPECGTELFDDVAVCWKCGANVVRTPNDGGLPLWAIFTAAGLLALLVLVWFVGVML
jgi:hypothetical protein